MDADGARGEILSPRPADGVSLGMRISTPVPPRRFPLLPPGEGWLPYLWLVNLPPVFIAPVQSGRAWQWAATSAAVLVFLASYFRAYWLSGRRVLPMIAVQCALAVALAPWNVVAPSFFVYDFANYGLSTPAPGLYCLRATVLPMALVTVCMAVPPCGGILLVRSPP